MSNNLYEVAFSGGIADGADPAQVRANIGKMFKADEAKLNQLFSGNRVVIKKNIDQQTALKYQAAIKNAGAICEVKQLSASGQPEGAQATPAPAPKATPASTPKPRPAASVSTDVQPAPDTDPLHITGDQIADLPADLAPVGSDVQDPKPDIPEPALDITGLSMAPPGADLEQIKNKVEPPVPDTNGLSLVDS
ncbi:MAG: hypothetical protein OQL09_08940 [Gammaproteobacteria bacterium]|nr:hypothetical protein [Gammaproteobacteria bacterium]